MAGTVRILRRFIGATMMISAFLLIFNVILLSVWVFEGMNKGNSPAVVVQQVAEGLQRSSQDDSYDADASISLLKQHHAWAMLLDPNGHVAWSYMLPDELPRSYSLLDVAKFSKAFLLDYPVFVWEHPDGLVVIGYPKGSLGKYQHTLPTEWVSSLPAKLLMFLLLNVAVALLLALLIGYRLVHSIRPIVQGIQALAEDKETYIEPKGVLADLAKSVNQAAALLRQKNERLKRKDEARSNWIAGISHDIRTPLSMVLGYASDLEEIGICQRNSEDKPALFANRPRTSARW